MLITIDTNNITQTDLATLKFVLLSADPTIDTDNIGLPEGGAEKPATTRRPRRTKAQIAADEAAAKAAAGGDTNDIQAAPQTDQELTDALDKESTATELKATIEQVVEAASKLIATDKTKMRAILDSFDARKVSDVPEDKLGDLLAAIQSA